MNNSNFGQWMATAILSLPILFLGWVMFGSGLGTGGGGEITTVASWVLAFIIILGVLYFTTMLAAKYRDKATKALKGIQNLFKGTENSSEKSTWKKWKTKSPEDKRWFLYSAIAVLAIMLAYTIPDSWTAEERYYLLGGFVVVAVHIVWLFFTDTTSITTKILVSAFLIFCFSAVLMPNTANKLWTDAKMAVNEYDARVKAGKPFFDESKPAVSVTQASPPYQPQPLSDEKIIPIDTTVVVTTPPGHRLSSVECPPENVMEITDGNTNTIRQVDCAGQITLKESELLNKEIAFFQKPGASAPSKIVVWWVKV